LENPIKILKIDFIVLDCSWNQTIIYVIKF